MKTNVDLEFINKVRELCEKMRDLEDFWLENQKELEDVNISKDYPFSKSFDELTFDTCNWYLTLFNEYCKNNK